MAENTEHKAALAAQNQMPLAQRLETRQRRMETDPERIKFDERTREVIRYARPDLIYDISATGPRGEKTTAKQYTSRPLSLLEKAADAFIGNVFGTSGWFGYKLEDERFDSMDEVQLWLERYAAYRYKQLANPETNFYAQLPSMAMDALSIGGAVQYIGLEDNVVYFEYCSLCNTYLMRNKRGQLKAVHQLVPLPAWEAYELWRDKCSRSCIEAAVNDPTKRFMFIRCVTRDTDQILNGVTLQNPRAYPEIWIEQSSEKNGVKSSPMSGILSQGGSEVFPYVDWPYWLKNNEVYPRGPLGTAIETVKALQHDAKASHIGAQRLSSPPVMAPASMKGQINLAADAINYVRNREDRIEAIHRGADITPLLAKMDRGEGELEDALQLQFFLMWSMATKQMSVPEVIQRIGERASAMMPRLGNLEKFYLNPTHNRLENLDRQLADLGFYVPETPPIIVEAVRRGILRGQIITKYTGPLHEAHVQNFMQRRTQGLYSSLEPLQQIDPTAVTDRINVDRAVEHVLDDGGFYQDAIRSDEEVQQIQQMRKAEAAARIQGELAKMGSEVDRNVATAQKTAAGM